MTASATLLTAMRQPGAMPLWVLELGTGSSKLRFASHYYASTTDGLYHGKVIGWGGWSRALADRSYSLETVSTTVTVADTDKVIAALVAGGSGSSSVARGAAAVIKRGDPTVATASWYTAFSGVVDARRLQEPDVWELTLRPDDLSLRRPVPRLWRIAIADWPGAPAASIGLLAPIIYGRHDSASLGAAGQVPLIRVGVGVYLAGAGILASVDRVYVDGDLQSSSDWTESNPRANGRDYTVVTFTTDPGDDAQITADLQGLTDDGDGSGSLITDPVDQLSNLLSNFVLADWQHGDWNSASSYQIDTASFTAAQTWVSHRGWAGSRRIADTTTGVALLNEWCASWGIYSYWSDAGKIALALDDHEDAAYATNALGVADPEIDGSTVSIDYPSEQLADRAETEVASQLFSVRDPYAKVGSVAAPLDVQMAWARDYFAA